MYKSTQKKIGITLMASLLTIMMLTTSSSGSTNLFTNTADAQEYYNNDEYRSEYPTDDYKYECRTGPFEGFFVSSVEFCTGKFNDREDNGYDESHKNLQIFPANKVAELGDRWWQWAFELDRTQENNPFTNTEQAGCDVGLQDNGKLLFLVGSGRDPVTGDFPVHKCDVKKGTSILFPIINVACNNLEVGTPFFGADEQAQRECANELVDKLIPNSLHVNIDGKEIQNPEQYRIDSPAGGFEFTAVPNNPFFTPEGDGTGVSDGFWILLQHLKPGKHTIEFSGALDLRELPAPFNTIFEAGATYKLNVKDSYY
jgi:hypothetical protein